jgi:hypothetical protein
MKKIDLGEKNEVGWNYYLKRSMNPENRIHFRWYTINVGTYS